MASTSAIVNRVLRSATAPILRGAGFAIIDSRNAWRWSGQAICVYNVRAVGLYFSKVTGWPPSSVNVSLGTYFPFIARKDGIKVDADGRLLPAEYQCQMRSHLECGLEYPEKRQSLSNPAERSRKDLWWIDPDGSNAIEVAADIAAALQQFGLPWFDRQSDLRLALAEVEEQQDCFTKHDTAAFLAREIGDKAHLKTYAAKAEAEALRINLSMDRQARYGA